MILINQEDVLNDREPSITQEEAEELSMLYSVMKEE